MIVWPVLLNWSPIFAASAVLMVCGLFVMGLFAHGLTRENFRGDRIPTGYGFALVIAAGPIWALRPFRGDALFFWLVLGFGILGLIDDIFGNREAGGFKGHLRLLAKGKVSTGLIKALGGGILGLAIGLIVADFNWAIGILNGLMISLCANTLNLLDLRPGRAVSCWWLGVLALGLTYHAGAVVNVMLPVFIPVLWLSVLDRSARVMIGDAGSNVLGAILGLAVVMSLGVPAKLALVILMAAVNIYSEKCSISRLIENNAVLTRLDRLLGER
jgi:UDP-GlcNAc:undecaprenyl-phosphate GlcNAc-1-phosphate transferase